MEQARLTKRVRRKLQKKLLNRKRVKQCKLHLISRTRLHRRMASRYSLLVQRCSGATRLHKSSVKTRRNMFTRWSTIKAINTVGTVDRNNTLKATNSV